MKRIFAIVAALALCMTAGAQDTNFAFRLPCELQTAGPASLADLTWQQGTTPHIAVSPLRLGRPVPVDPLTTVRMIIGRSGTVTNYALATNWLATNGAYYVQFPTVGTNSAGTNATAQAWWYTVHFERDGRRYWTGDGRLYIEPTTSTAADGLAWQEITAGAATDLVARAQIQELSNVVAGIEVGSVSYGILTNTAYRGDWGHSVSGRVDSVSNLARLALTTNESRKATLRGGALISDNAWVYRITSITNASGNLSSNWTGEYRTNWTGSAGTSAIHRTGGRFFFTGADGLRFIGGINMADNVTNWVYLYTNGAWRDRSAGAVFVAIDTNQSYSATAQALGVNTESARTNLPYLGNRVGVDIVDRVLVVEKPAGYYSTAPTLPAISAIGYDIRQNGRIVLWLNSAGYTAGGTNYDFPADLFFGTGTNMTDASIRWTISSRPVVPRASGHTYDQLAIFEADGAGDTTGTIKRVGITPDRNGDPGGIWLGNAFSSDPAQEAAVSNSTVAVVDRARTASLRIVADETDGTTNRAVFSMKQGTNTYEKALAYGAITETINGVAVSSGGSGISAATATGISYAVIGAAPESAFSNLTFGATATVMCATGTWYDASTRTAYTTSCPSGTGGGTATVGAESDPLIYGYSTNTALLAGTNNPVQLLMTNATCPGPIYLSPPTKTNVLSDYVFKLVIPPLGTNTATWSSGWSTPTPTLSTNGFSLVICTSHAGQTNATGRRRY